MIIVKKFIIIIDTIIIIIIINIKTLQMYCLLSLIFILQFLCPTYLHTSDGSVWTWFDTFLRKFHSRM